MTGHWLRHFNAFPVFCHNNLCYQHHKQLMPIFFLKDKESIKEVMNVFDTSIYSSLKPSKFKCEIACFGLQKGLSIDLCEVEWINLTKNSVNFSYFFFLLITKLKMKRTLLSLVKNWQCSRNVENKKQFKANLQFLKF